jgi:hypothetical protein
MIAPPQAPLVEPAPQFAPSGWLSTGRVAAGVA